MALTWIWACRLRVRRQRARATDNRVKVGDIVVDNQDRHVFVSDMEQAVRIAYERTTPGGICLLSPASPSFGMFKDYRERGDSFKAFVRKLSNS